MFANPPQILAHVSVLDQGNFVLPDIILNKSDSGINLLHRHCPHRRFPLHTAGEHVTNIVCKFHNFEWDRNGTPVNNTKKLRCGTATVGRSGLVFRHFNEPSHAWVDDLTSETALVYSHCCQGSSKGSWLWLMDAEADLLHLYKGGIHPFLSAQIDLADIKLDQGPGWIHQSHPHGWWLYIFPFTFVEYGRPGCVMVNRVVPHDVNTEYGFDWITQFYYHPDVSANTRMLFETLETVFKEDVATIEMQKGNYFPLSKAMNTYEDHCVHWGHWVQANKTQ